MGLLIKGLIQIIRFLAIAKLALRKPSWFW